MRSKVHRYPMLCGRVIMATLLLAAQAVQAQPPAGQPAPARTKEQAAMLTAPTADVITTEFLAPAVRQAVANGVATLIARIKAEGNDHGLAFPPAQTVKVVEVVEVAARRVQIDVPIYEMIPVEVVEPVMESGKPTGRFQKVTRHTAGKKIGSRKQDTLTPDPNGSEKMGIPKYGPGGPAAWAANLPGLNGMALYVLAKAGLKKHPATVKHAEALAAHATEYNGLPDSTFDLAWMTAGYAALGNAKYDELLQRLVGKLIDGQIREKVPLDGLWGPVCVNYGYFGKLFTLGQTVKQELDINIPQKLKSASPAEEKQLISLGKDMQVFASEYARTHRDVFRCGTRMLGIRSAYAFEQEAILPGLPVNAYQWVTTDVESTQAALFALAEVKRVDALPKETERLKIRSKNIFAPVKTEAAIKAAAKRLADVIDDDGGCSPLAFRAANTGFAKSGFPAPSFYDGETLAPLFDVETACSSVEAEAAIEALSRMGSDLAKQLAEPRKRSLDRAAKIAARWYAESANPAADPWKGMYQTWKVSHADLTKSAILPVPKTSDSIDSLPWGPLGSLYRIVPGFRGLFADASQPKDRFGNDLFRQIAYRLVALQDTNGQWTSPGGHLLSTAAESLTINRIAELWHQSLTRTLPVKISAPDPVTYEAMLYPEHAGWSHSSATRADTGAFPTLASLLFLLDGLDRPVSLDGITILPEGETEPAKDADPSKPPPRLTPLDAVRKVGRPNAPREELFAAIIATQWPRGKPEAAPATTPAATEKTGDKPGDKPATDAKGKAKDEKEDDGLGTFEDLLKPTDEKK